MNKLGIPIDGGKFGAQILLSENLVPQFIRMFDDTVYAYHSFLPQ